MDCFDLQHRRDTLWHALQKAAAQTPLAHDALAHILQELIQLERFWTYPGRGVMLQLAHYLETQRPSQLAQLVNNCYAQLHSGRYRQQPFRPFQTNLELLDKPVLLERRQLDAASINPVKPYFEVLIVHPLPDEYEMLYRQQLAACKSAHDEFVYDIVLLGCATDALTAILANTSIQACVYLNHVPPATPQADALFGAYCQPLVATTPPLQIHDSVEVNLCRTLRHLRPELDHYLISEQSAPELPLYVRGYFDRVLFHIEPFQDLHAAILNGVRNRFSTPFFDALRAYSRQPKGVFHALPLSRGASVRNSPWARDMLDFYGGNIFLAETSSTQGGLDSLLDPTGAIRQAHIKAAETFGADHSYFVTNGTSTSNKIVFHANVKPGDIVLISADCHKSIPYSVMLAGAYPIFLETYPLLEHDLYGGVALQQIKAVMLDLKERGLLERLRQITLTNSTFDGLLYHSEKYMMEILAIKPDIIFHWDEAWSAFAGFHPLYHSRMAMSAARKIRQRLQSIEYQQFYAQWSATFMANGDASKWQQVLYPDPAQVKLRVYVTQSTHKTLTAFRQGSMIHVTDALFDPGAFLEAFRMHTSTSPNYQIIASLDIGRRQAALEGFQQVRETLFLATQLRQRINESVELQPWFQVLTDADMIPMQPSHHDHAAPPAQVCELAALSARWGAADFVIDPTRVTLNVRNTGLDGSSVRQLLMTRYDIQVNKTSRHTVLFLINIGATQATIDYLLQVLHEMASKFQHERRNRLPIAQEVALALPEQRLFHPCFLPCHTGEHAPCDIRDAYFAGTDAAQVCYLPLSSDTLEQARAGRQWVSASFVTPYPPGFPVMVPGQIITPEILDFFHHIKVKEIHGYHAELGFKVFTDAYLANRPLPVVRLFPDFLR